MEFETIKLGDLYDVASGLSKSAKEFGNGGYPFLSFKTIFYNYFLPDELPDLANTTGKEQEKCSILEGDVFLTRTSETANELGMSSVALKDYPCGTFNGFSKRLRMKQNCGYKVYPKYMGYFLRSAKFRNQINSMSIASTRASLNIEMINRLTVDLPDIECQKKIADFLFLIDKKIKNSEAINRNLSEQLKVLFEDMFIIKADNTWEDKKLGDFLELERGLSYKGKFLSEGEGVPMLNLGNILPNSVFRPEKLKFYTGEFKPRNVVKPGDIIVANTDLTQAREVLGSAIRVPSLGYDTAICSHHISIVRNCTISNNFILGLLNMPAYRTRVAGFATGTTVLALPNDTNAHRMNY